MLGIVIVSHGNFAEGILQSLEMIAGKQNTIKAVTLKPLEKAEDFKIKLEQTIDSYENADQILIIADIWGGTPFNQAKTLVEEHEDSRALMTGLNLPMLVEAYFNSMVIGEAKKLAEIIAPVGKDSIKIYSK